MCARSGDNDHLSPPGGSQTPAGELTSREGGRRSLSRLAPGLPAERNIFYFRKDLSNGGMADRRRIQNFAESSKGSAGHVPEKCQLPDASTTASPRSGNFILSDSRLVLQDPSGVPFRYFNDGGGWDVRLYGNYTGPLEHFQRIPPGRSRVGLSGRPEYPVIPMKAGVGYLRSCLILARN